MIQYNEIPNVIRFANSEFAENMNEQGVKLRKGFTIDLHKTIGSNGQVSRSSISNVAIRYANDMFETWNRDSEIDGFIKGYISYEVSCAISMIFPTINDIDTFKELLTHFDIDLCDKNASTLIMLSNIDNIDSSSKSVENKNDYQSMQNIATRIQIVDNFIQIINSMQITSFKIRLGDDNSDLNPH